MFETILANIEQHFYPGYAVAVWGVTSLIRWLFNGIDRSIHPKWVTLVVGLVLGLGGFAWYTLNGIDFDFFKAVTSFAIATISYDYFGKPLFDKIQGKEFYLGKKIHR